MIASEKISKERPQSSSREFKLWNHVEAAEMEGDIEEALRQIDLLIR